MAARRCELGKIFAGCMVLIFLISSVNAECVTTELFLSDYTPTRDTTPANITCERWDQLPTLTAGLDFKNESLLDAGNFCRDPDGSNKLWCYGVPVEEIVACYEDSSSTYTGDVSLTASGHFCQRWSDSSPNSHNFKDNDFPDKSIDDAANFCRDPDSLGTPWCFTLVKEVRWEACDISKCKPLEEKVQKMDCGIDFCEPVTSGCPRGWRRSKDGDRCYSVSGSRATWHEASTNCESFGATQLEIDDNNEYFFLLNVLLFEEKDIFWLGLSDEETEGKFIWRSSRREMSFSDWYPGEPDNFFRSEHCVGMFIYQDSYKWRDDNCERSYNYICETAATEVVMTEPAPVTEKPNTTPFTEMKTTIATSGYDKCGVNMVVIITADVLLFGFFIMF